MHISFFNVNFCILDIVVDTVKNRTLFYYQNTEIFKKYGQTIYRIGEFWNFWTSMLLLLFFQILFENLRVIDTRLSLLWANQFLYFHIVILFHLSQF